MIRRFGASKAYFGLQVLRMGTNINETKIISGVSVGTIYVSPRMAISPSDNKISFKLNRIPYISLSQ